MEVVELPRLFLIDRPGLRSIQQRWQYDSFVHLEFDAEVETVSIPDDVLHAFEGLAGFNNPVGDLIVDFGAVGEADAQVSELVLEFQLSAVDIDAGCIVRGIELWLTHDHQFLRVDYQSEIFASGREEVHALLKVPFCSCIERTVVSKEKFVDDGCGYTRLGVQLLFIEELAIHPVGDVNFGAFVMVGVH
ncbi:unnamed protein product [Schistocephalus solidus]|uniref:Uncharacterized protein n=1 Tax=Schistocephalus solidus TaxID=70667 RepID=A0A183TE13_SCHSO|nr:unnamed protein product [Schistocephalus solidus]